MSSPADLDVEQAILDYEEQREAKKSQWKFFGRRLTDIPCFRESYLTGILSGLGVGLGYFLFTSRVRRSCDVAVYSFAAITTGSWCYCRYDRSSHARDLARFQHEMRQRSVTMGVKDEKDRLDLGAGPDEDVDVTIAPKVKIWFNFFRLSFSSYSALIVSWIAWLIEWVRCDKKKCFWAKKVDTFARWKIISALLTRFVGSHVNGRLIDWFNGSHCYTKIYLKYFPENICVRKFCHRILLFYRVGVVFRRFPSIVLVLVLSWWIEWLWYGKHGLAEELVQFDHSKNDSAPRSSILTVILHGWLIDFSTKQINRAIKMLKSKSNGLK